MCALASSGKRYRCSTHRGHLCEGTFSTNPGLSSSGRVTASGTPTGTTSFRRAESTEPPAVRGPGVPQAWFGDRPGDGAPTRTHLQWACNQPPRGGAGGARLWASRPRTSGCPDSTPACDSGPSVACRRLAYEGGRQSAVESCRAWAVGRFAVLLWLQPKMPGRAATLGGKVERFRCWAESHEEAMRR